MPIANKNAETFSSRKKHIKGFTLIEMLLSTMLGGVVIGVVAFTFANMAGSFAEQPTTGQTFDWDNARSIPYSPAYSQLPQAFNLQAEISDALQATTTGGMVTNKGGSGYVTAVFVVSSEEKVNGATEVLPSVPAGTGPDISVLPGIAGVGASRLTSSGQFYSLLNPTAGGFGYSIYFISNDSHVSMAVHCRMRTSGNDTIYTVKTYADGVFCPTLSYAFGVRNLRSTVLPGAKYVKLRTNAAWDVSEDVGTQIILPDPAVVAYQRDASDAQFTYSRFSMLLPLKP